MTTELKTVHSLLKDNPDTVYTLKDIWWELRDESKDLEHCHDWQTMYYQMLNQIESLWNNLDIVKPAETTSDGGVIGIDGKYKWNKRKGEQNGN